MTSRAAVLFVSLLGLPAVAYGEGVTLTEAQAELYTRAMTQYQDGDYAGAAETFEYVLKLGDVDAVRLAYGRALFSGGNCSAALEQYEASKNSPHLSGMTADELDQRRGQYVDDLATCPGRLILLCSPDDAIVRIDGGEPISCPNGAVELPSGQHKVAALLGAARAESTFDVRAMQDTVVELALQLPEEPASVAVTEPPHDRRPIPGSALALWGAGGGLLLTGLIFDVGPTRAAIAKFESAVETRDPNAFQLRNRARGWQVTTVVTYSVGAALALAGGVVFVLPRTKGSVSLGITPSGLAVRGILP